MTRFLNEDSIAWASGQNNFFTYAGNDPISNTDPSGNDVAVEGGLNNILQYVKARNYLMKDPRMAAIIHTLERSPVIFYIQILPGANCNHQYDYKTHTIYWNPTCGMNCTNGGGQSPALQLGHEMDHATNPNPNLDWIPRSPYDNAEERRVIEGSENSAAHTLNEGVRHDHRGTDAPYLPSPTTIPPGNRL